MIPTMTLTLRWKEPRRSAFKICGIKSGCRELASRTIRHVTAASPFRPSQINNQPGLGQRSGRGENDRMLCFVSPKLFDAQRFCSFLRHGFTLAHVCPSWQVFGFRLEFAGKNRTLMI
jgi:hypothetical protein